MNKAFMTFAISVVLSLIMPMSVWADFLDFFINPATLHIGNGTTAFNFRESIRKNYDHLAPVNFGEYQNNGGNNFIIDDHFALFFVLINRTSGIKFPMFTAAPCRRFLGERMTSNKGTAGVFSDKITTLINIAAQPLPKNTVTFESSLNSFGIYAFSLSASANAGAGRHSDIIWSHNGLRSGTFISEDGKDEGEAKIYFTPFTDFAIVKKVLEPGTMLLLGICVLSLGLFAIKIRK